MFKLAQNVTYLWPVTVELPAEGGKTEQHTFDAKFKLIPQSKIDGYMTGDDTSDAKIADDILVGWDGITDESGDPVPFTASTKAAILDVPNVRTAIVKAWGESLLGSKRKN